MRLRLSWRKRIELNARDNFIPITDDPEVLERIYRHIKLRSHPLKLQGNFIDGAVSLGVLADGDFLGFLVAYEAEGIRVDPKQFAFLTTDENLAITCYRHIRPVEAWPQPILNVAWDELAGEGRVLGTSHVTVVLQNIGNAQLWWGGEVGVIWEAYFEERVRVRTNHELLMHQFWQALERYLAEQGVKRVYTYDADPAIDEAWYKAFLANRDYQPKVVYRRRSALMKELA